MSAAYGSSLPKRHRARPKSSFRSTLVSIKSGYLSGSTFSYVYDIDVFEPVYEVGRAKLNKININSMLCDNPLP